MKPANSLYGLPWCEPCYVQELKRCEAQAQAAQLYEQLSVTMTMARNTLTAIAQFDAMTHLGYKLNLITQQYHL